MTLNTTDERWMRLALTLGQRGLGQVWPNPAVGCVLVKNGRVIGRGWTQSGGRPHAEVHALAAAGEAARGSTAYVTLEPCAHHGQTGPCAHSLVNAGVERVVCATSDPDPRVNGKGFKILRDAGIPVTENVMKAEADAAHAGFFKRIQNGRPFVTLKLASSLDGRIATQTGDSRWITGAAARRSVHLMRAQHDAILVGRNTVDADNPDLSVRDMGLVARSPVRVILDSRLTMKSDARVLKTSAIPTWICHGTGAEIPPHLQNAPARLFPCALDDQGRVDIRNVLKTLADQGITRLMVEGGGQVAASLLTAGCVDQLALYSGGVAIGADGLPNLASLGISALNDAPRFERQSVQAIGPDVLTLWNYIP